jgi:hypothetical protein
VQAALSVVTLFKTGLVELSITNIRGYVKQLGTSTCVEVVFGCAGRSCISIK